ncbi:PX domain containing protein [Tritrichomonas foetus]|uniref:PX domain containing protein n=1 Tax=Tritrichomonas foetus TaxID=1144522 RepID=A0A1J4J8L6_9EUKA|nr:PX domain containing protein [Tritrichomonas foetus]|eukprot:OHS94583.1 PX domain containing protein [Tritrichomonas foetus]
MNLDASVIDAIKEKQLEGCPVDNKIALIITGHQEDAAAKATFFNTRCYLFDSNGAEQKTSEGRYRYSQLLDFNDSLIHDYGAIRLLRTFPPKKWVGNKEGDFVAQRMEALQNWLTELCLDEETAQDKKVLAFFNLNTE